MKIPGNIKLPRYAWAAAAGKPSSAGRLDFADRRHGALYSWCGPRFDALMLLFTHPAMLRHEPPEGHPERPARLEAVLKHLESVDLERRTAPLAEREAVARVHPVAYLQALDRVFAEARERGVQLDPDTHVSPGSREAAYRAAGACVAAVDAVLGDEADMAFCAVRPPGHHAEPMQAMGFCVFNNVAIAALHALEQHQLGRVAVVDFDVHHGNGTQTIAEREPRLLFCSAHQFPLYPGTGLASETGIDGNVVNAPYPRHTDSGAWRAVMEEKVFPALDAFAPDLILVSAGFDAHRADQLAFTNLEDEDFAWVGRGLRQAALTHCKGKLVSTLEGGYDLDALARSVAAYLAALQHG